MNRNYPLKDKSSEDILIDEDLNDPCYQLEDLINVIKSSIKIHIFPLFLKKLYEYLDKIIAKKYKNIAVLKFENEEIVVNFNFEQKYENYFIRFAKYIENNRFFVKITYSHRLFNNDDDDNNTYINNFKEIIKLNDLNAVNLELKFNEGLRCFYSLQYDRIISNLCLFDSNELHIKYELKDNKIKCYLDNDHSLFSLIIDNKGTLYFIDESMNFTFNEKIKIINYIKSLINKNNVEISKINDYYLYLYNTVLKKYFINIQDCYLNKINDDYVFNVSLFDNLFFDNPPQFRKNCSLRFIFEINKETYTIKKIKYFLVIIGKKEIIYDKNNEIYENFNDSKIKFENFERIYEIIQRFKKNNHTNIQILLEAINYGNIDINSNYSTIIMNRIDLQISNDKEFLEFFSINEYYEKLEINLNRCLNFKIVLTTRFV